MIRFYCEGCGKEMWELADWNGLKYLTLAQVKEQLLCSDCLLAEVHTAEAEEAARWTMEE